MRLVGSIAGVLLVTGCGGTPAAEVPDISVHSNGELPITQLVEEAHILTRLQSVREDELAAACMRAQGFDVPFPPRSRESLIGEPLEAPELTVERAERYGYQWWREFGVHEDIEREAAEANQRIDGFGPEGAAEWALAFFGPEEDMISIDTAVGRLSTGGSGCLAEARAQIAGGVRRDLEWSAAVMNLEELANGAQVRAEADPAVQDALVAWSRCMHDRGHDVDTIEEAYDLAAEGGSLEAAPGGAGSSDDDQGPSAWEIEVAVDDARCREAAGYDETLRERRSAYENELLAEHEDVILTWREVRDEMRSSLTDLVTEFDLAEETGG